MERLKRIWSAIKGEPRVIIHKVEIIVQAAEDPNKTAYAVAEILSGWKRQTRAVA